MKGLFIVIDGCDAAGKSTLVSKLVENLNGMGIETISTREPGGTKLGEEVRRLMLSLETEVLSPEVELMLLTAARRHHLETVIYPAIEKGVTVICDRYNYSTYAYQGAGKGVDEWRIFELEGQAQITEPDLALIMDVPVDIAAIRMSGRGQPTDKMEQQGQAFFEKIRKSFIDQVELNAEVAQLVDASKDPETVFEDVLGRVKMKIVMLGAEKHRRDLAKTA